MSVLRLRRHDNHAEWTKRMTSSSRPRQSLSCFINSRWWGDFEIKRKTRTDLLKVLEWFNLQIWQKGFVVLKMHVRIFFITLVFHIAPLASGKHFFLYLNDFRKWHKFQINFSKKIREVRFLIFRIFSLQLRRRKCETHLVNSKKLGCFQEKNWLLREKFSEKHLHAASFQAGIFFI